MIHRRDGEPSVTTHDEVLIPPVEQPMQADVRVCQVDPGTTHRPCTGAWATNGEGPADVDLLQRSFEHGEPAGPLRRDAGAVLESCCSADCVDDVLVVISELVQSVTQHTAGGGELVLRRTGEVVEVEVRDGDAALPRPKSPDERRIGGRGLLVVAGVAQDWGARREGRGKVVWARVTDPAGVTHGVAA